MARFEARELFNAKGESQGWFIFEGVRQRPGPAMTMEAAMSEANRLNIEYEQIMKEAADRQAKRSSGPSMGR